MVCRNPHLAAERARKREDLLAATEKELGKVRQMVSGPRGSLRNADAGKIGQRAGRVVNKYKVAKHFELQIADGSFSYQRKTEQITEETARLFASRKGKIMRGIDLIQKSRGIDSDLDSGLRLDVPENAFR